MSKAPAVANTWVKLWPGARLPLPKLEPVTVCVALSLFVQVTDWPSLMVTCAGWNEKLAIVTCTAAAGGLVGAGGGAAVGGGGAVGLGAAGMAGAATNHTPPMPCPLVSPRLTSPEK